MKVEVRLLLNTEKVIPIKKVELSRDDMPKNLPSNKKNNSNFIVRGPREFFKGILDGYEKY